MRNSGKINFLTEIEKLKGEKPAVSEVVTERGILRLYINGSEVYPLLAWSWKLVESTPIFRKAGINLLHPIIGLNAAWPEPDKYDWELFDQFFAQLLTKNPNAYFLPRIHLDVPNWWKEKYPDDYRNEKCVDYAFKNFRKCETRGRRYVQFEPVRTKRARNADTNNPPVVFRYQVYP